MQLILFIFYLALIHVIFLKIKFKFMFYVVFNKLFFISVLLCGIEGYSEFLRDKWILKILSWQNIHGCYGNEGYDSLQKRAKRHTVFLDYGCYEQMNGLAAAVLALHLRYKLNGPLWSSH